MTAVSAWLLALTWREHRRPVPRESGFSDLQTSVFHLTMARMMMIGTIRGMMMMMVVIWLHRTCPFVVHIFLQMHRS